MKTWHKYLIGAVIIIAIILLVRGCEHEPKIKTITKIVYKERTDTITNTIIKEGKPIYYEVIKTIKGKDSIVYVTKPSDSSLKAQIYDVNIKTDSSSADLKITSLTKPIDVFGTIKCFNKETKTKETIIKAKSGLFIYGETSVSPMLENIGVGLDYQIKNDVIIGTSVNYSTLDKNVYFNVKLGFRVF